MTGPEAIAAAERLRDKLRTILTVERNAVDSVVLGVYVSAKTVTETADTLDSLRAALLQSQEALMKIAHRGRDGYWLDTDGPDVIARAILLSPPVASKER